ncbi:GNAT family N-acetyltransferase [Lacticaseibacillus daqingensis]|uniref:GNAT family N-acetyltransferase n=1 Tax=Lacticaseibacillus daqingensis TaxID=2486014 RepID=UPI000F7BAFA9|nr:GNAT family N-acetyltransferase [Lacticaseibacillus daqingensis]
MADLTQQFALDFNAPQDWFVHPKQNRFITAPPQAGSRWWAQGAVDIVAYAGQLFVRASNSAVTQALADHFAHTDAAWFAEQATQRTLAACLHPFGLTLSLAGPFWVPRGPLKAPTLAGVRWLTRTEQARANVPLAFADDDTARLGVGLYRDGQLQTACGASQNGRDTWEFGVAHQTAAAAGHGGAAALVQLLAARIQADEPQITPVYGTQFSHVLSLNVAVRAGFKLGWCEWVATKALD